MRRLFLHLDFLNVYRWSDYFNIPLTEENIRLVVDAKINNSRIVGKNRKTALSLPVTMMVGYIFVQSGELVIIPDQGNENIHLCEGEFAKYPSGHYLFEHSGESKWISMWLYEDFPEEIQNKII